MAKSAGFFTLRRGSTKSLTFQVLDGKQITKDRVSVVKNPKTSRQAEQRAKLLPAQRFMTMLRSIVDHSWENIAYGQKSLQHFMSKAMRIKPENPMVKGEIGWYPQRYPISEGSLPSMRATINADDSTEMNVPGLPAGASFAEVLNKGILQEGDQLTAIGVYVVNDTYVVKIDRTIFNAENVLPDAEGAYIDTQNGTFSFTFSTTPKCTDKLGNQIAACAVVLSRRTASKWLRSSETMDAYNDNNVLWSTAVASYMNNATELTSPWYLNAADNNVISPADIEGGEWSPLMLGPVSPWGTGNTIYLGAKNNLYGNFAVVTTDGTSIGFAYSFSGLNSGKTVADVVLSDFTQSQTRGNAVQPAAVSHFANFGSNEVGALADGQPDQFLKASVVGK